MAEQPMTEQGQIDLVLRYFSGVDGEDIETVLSTLTPDCVFRVETHGVELTGHAEVAAMLRRLWDNHKAVCHRDFAFVCDPGRGRIAAQFQVVNTEHDGSKTHKSNCNFFDLAGGRFSRVSVYMAGQNTLNRES